MNEKRLYKSKNKTICGVCAGIAEYFNLDPTIVRLVTFILIVPGGLSIWTYIIAAIIMPEAPMNYHDDIYTSGR